MTFFYSDNSEPFTGSFIPYSEQPAGKYYITHYSNYLYLNFILTHESSTFAEKTQAKKELDICERKLAYWRRHPNWSHEATDNEVAKLKSEWSGKRAA